MIIGFIFMTLAWVIATCAYLIQRRVIRKQEEELEEYRGAIYSNMSKVYRRTYEYIIVADHGEFGLSQITKQYESDGYTLDREMSTDRLLVFVKSIEVNDTKERTTD